jgi:WXG100 family type VII secretion target
MSNIRVSPEQVRAVARRFRAESDNCRNMLQRVNSQVNGFQWEGLAKQRFMGDYEQWAVKMRSYANQLDSIAQQLETVAVRFAQADQQGL